MRDGSVLIEKTQDILGLEAYRIFPDSRRFIPDVIVASVAAACLGEFIKGFVNFKKLGEGARAKFDELIRRWRAKDDFERYAKQEDAVELVSKAIATIPEKLPSLVQAQARLQAALEEFGLSKAAAEEHAKRIAQLLENED